MDAEQIKSTKEKITMLTAYGYPFARVLEQEKIDIILVGDSLGNVVLGYNSTREVTMDDMIRHTKAVRNGAKESFIVADMPYQSDKTLSLAVMNARKLIEAGANAVKLEGKPNIVKGVVAAGIDVMGHIGYLPQTSGKPAVSKDYPSLIKEAKALSDAGVFAVVLEMVDKDVAGRISHELTIPTIGIGSGVKCDGQVLVIDDMLGLFDKFKPRFVKRYAHLADEARKAVGEYIREVKEGKFPDDEHSF